MKSIVALSLFASASADSTVSKVVQLLDELKGKVQADLDKEAEAMDGYTKWCETQKTETSYAIKDEKRIISEQSALVEAGTAKIEEESSKIAELGPAIAASQKEVEDAAAVRAENQKTFMATEKELVEAEDMLRRAHGILKRATGGSSLLQAGSKMEEVVAALGAIVDATWVSSAHKEHVQAFLQSEDLSLAPQASTSNYDSKSGGILTTIDEMRDETMENLRAARTENTKQKHAHELFAQSKANEIATFNKQLAQAKNALAGGKNKKGAAEKALAAEKATLEADSAYLAECSKSCADKASMWAERQASANEEMSVLDQAKEVLASKVVVLAQTGMKTRRVSADSLDKREKVVSMLRRLGRRFNSFGLLQAASAASADPFEKVRGLIKEMIAKLEKQAADEASQKEVCDKNLKENREKKANKEAALEKYNTRFTGAQAKQTKRKSEISELQKELKELAVAVKEATELRNKSHTDNTAIIEDNKASAAAVAEAITILRGFYGGGDEGAAFVQRGEAAPGVEFASAKSGASGSIIAILETSQADFTKLFQETEEEEAAELADYKKLMQEAEVTKAKKDAAIMGKTSELKSLKVQLQETQTDIDSTTQELTDVQTALTAWEEKCANKAMSYEERKQRREAELAGLQEALEILAPSEEGAAFLQRRDI
jgi:chromosome segregation ATPase